MNVERLQKMVGSIKTSGKATMRRKQDNYNAKRLPAIEEVNIFKEDVAIQFVNPKVQTSNCSKHMGC